MRKQNNLKISPPHNLIQQYIYNTITCALTSKDHFRHNQQQEEKRQRVVTASTKQKPTTQIYINMVKQPCVMIVLISTSNHMLNLPIIEKLAVSNLDSNHNLLLEA